MADKRLKKLAELICDHDPEWVCGDLADHEKEWEICQAICHYKSPQPECVLRYVDLKTEGGAEWNTKNL